VFTLTCTISKLYERLATIDVLMRAVWLTGNKNRTMAAYSVSQTCRTVLYTAYQMTLQIYTAA